MTLWKTVAVRLALLAGLTFFLGAAGALSIARVIVREIATRRMAPVARDGLRDVDLAGCRSSTPAPVERAGTFRYDFYDASGAPLHPGAPEIDRPLFEEPSLEPLQSRFDPRTFRARALFRVDAGPCALVMATWAPTPRRPGALLLPVGGTLFALAGLLSLLVFVFVARPLLLRLAAAQREIEGRHASLERFLAETMHDVRTPLSSLQLALDELADEAPLPADSPLRRALDDTMYIGSLFSNLRLSTRLDAGFLPLAAGLSFDVVAVAERVSRRLQPFAVRRGITITTDLPSAKVLAPGDETAAEQAIANLVENAVSHGEPGMRVRIEITPHEDVTRIQIADDGPGMSPADIAKLMDRSPADEKARSRRARGSGLGLTITRTVCDLSGYGLSFEVREPHGLAAIIEMKRPPAPGREMP